MATKKMGCGARHDVPAAFADQLQKLLDQTFKDTKTRDRKTIMPTRLKLLKAQRIEDRNMSRRALALVVTISVSRYGKQLNFGC